MVSLATPIYISVRAVTNKLGDDISRGLGGSQRRISRDGENLGRAFTQGFNKGVDVNAFRRVANGIRSMVPEADRARAAFSTLIRTSYTLGTALTTIVGGASAAISAIGALGGAAIGAASTVSVLGNALFALGAGMVASRLALGGVGSALSKLNKQTTTAATTSTRTALQTVRDSQARENATRRIEDAERSLARTISDNAERIVSANQSIAEAQIDLNRALRDGREELQQIGFDAEDAALNESRAALSLEKARETLARVQDLPPNSRARREAELAYQEAELNYRKAKDANADLADEQDRLARSGVNGLSSVIAARDRLAEAEADKAKVVKDALQSEEDALRDVAQARKDAANVDDRQDATAAPEAAGGAAAMGADWAEGLNNAQRNFVLFLNSLRPKIDELKNMVSEAFLPRLQTAITILMDRGFDTISTGLETVAAAMGDAAITLAEVITEGQNLDKLATLFDSSAVLIDLFAQALGNTYDILLSILTTTAPLAEEFFGFLNEQLGQFADHLNSDEGKAELISFFDRAAFTARLFGDVFGNVMGGIGAIINANIGPGTGGQILLDYFKTATEDWGSGGMNDFFVNVANNATKVFDVLGELVGILGRVGENQNLGKAFEVLLEGAPALENILQTTVDAAPQFADLVVTITEIVSALADTGAMQVFFETLNNILTPILDFVRDPANKEFLDFWGRIFAMFSAVGFVGGLVSTGLKIIAGSITGLLSPIASAVGVTKNLVGGLSTFNNMKGATMTTAAGITGKLTVMGTAARVATGNTEGMSRIFQILGAPARGFSAAIGAVGAAATGAGKGIASFGRFLLPILGPIGLVVGVVGGLVALFVHLYNTNDQFKKDMDRIWADLSKTFMDAGQQIMEALEPLGAVFTQIVDAIVPLVTTIVSSLVPVITSIVEAIAPLVSTIITALVPVFEMLANVLGFIVPIIAGILTVVVEVLAGILTVVVEVLTAVITWIIDAITNFGTNWSNFWDTIFTFFSDTWNNIATFFGDVWQGILDAMNAAWQWIDKYIFQPISLAMQAVGRVFDTVGKFIGDVWRNIQAAINLVWKWIDANIFKPISDAIALVGLAFQFAGQVISDAWNNMMTALNIVWMWIDDNIFSPIKTAVGLVQQAFENVAAGIAKAWDGIKKAAAVPINFVIDTVYNNGLRSFWNDIAGNLGMNNLKLPKANKIAFASGGVMPGYSPGKDIHKFYSPTGGFLHLSGGEAIMRPEWTRAVGGPSAVARMNRAARSGQAFATGGVYGSGPSRVQRFAGGGVLDFAGDVIDNLGDIFAIIGDFFTNPLDAVQKHLVDGLIKPLLKGGGDNKFSEMIGGFPIKIAGGIGKAVEDFFGAGGGIKGTSGMGWKAMSALVTQAIPGARITSAYRPGSVTVNGGPSYHGAGRAVDVVPATMETFNRMLALFPNARELIYSPAGNRQLLNGKPHYWTGAVRATHWDHVHAAMKDGGTVFPSKDGTIVQVAEAGRAERIEPLDDNGLSDRDKAWAELFTEGLRGETTINVYQQPGEDGEELARRVSRIISRDVRRGALT